MPPAGKEKPLFESYLASRLVASWSPYIYGDADGPAVDDKRLLLSSRFGCFLFFYVLFRFMLSWSKVAFWGCLLYMYVLACVGALDSMMLG